MVMTRRRTIWFLVVVVLFVAGLGVAVVWPAAGVDVLMVAVIALAGLLLVLQRAARHTEGWDEPGPFYAGSGLGPRGPRKPDP